MEEREDEFILAVQFSFLKDCGRGYDVELRVGFSLEVGGAINVNLALF